MRKNTTLMATMSVAFMIGLSACNQSQASEPEEASSSQVSVDSLSLDNAWVKAADDGMTAVFGELKNNSDKDINLVAAKYDDADQVQLHETLEDNSGGMSMQEKKGGFAIPAGQSLSLKPGGDHIMVMGLAKPIKPGEEISLELVTADQQSFPVTAIAKDYSGAQENYAPGEADGEGDGADHDDMDHKDMDHGDADRDEMDHGDSGDH
ncbi:copper chaperone PCu(A)C [Brevibacterium sp. RIT 803]|uniref:copper chaperone PCu(A)C n=1 Tax=Brevibacterium sp. RIT 803 TaxID=2810210 RepID=UPI00194EE28D|nr:copper chaperone PCu(A)C [Brevibacterium sp. RIT 803]MBM6589757.1 copper chaperone PCu(A)C [Brevibacterium sp. RIT 803]